MKWTSDETKILPPLYDQVAHFLRMGHQNHNIPLSLRDVKLIIV